MSDGYASRTLRELLRIVASRFLGMVVILVVVIVAAAVVTVLAPKWYRSKVVLLASPTLANPLEEQAAILKDRVSLFVVTQREIIKSDTVLASALMRLENRPETVSRESWYGDAEIVEYIRGHRRLMERVRKRVKVITPGGPDATFTQTVTIRVDFSQPDETLMGKASGSPEATARRSHDLANAIKEAYLMRYTQLESRRTGDAAALLKQRSLAIAKANVDEADDAVSAFIESELQGDLLQVQNMIVGVGAETGDASLATRFRGEINKIDESLAELGALKTIIQAELDKGRAGDLVVPDAVTAANPSVSKLQEQIVDTRLLLNALLPRYTEDYQEVRHARAELEATRSDLYDELVSQRGRLGQEMAVLNARRATLKAKVAEDRRRVDKLASKVAKYQRLQKDVQSAQAIYESEQRRVVGAVTAQQIAAKPILVSVLDEATWPDAQQARRPILWLNLLIAALSGLVLSFIYAFLGDYFDHSLKSMDVAERYLGVPVVASVPRLKGRFVRTRRGG